MYKFFNRVDIGLIKIIPKEELIIPNRKKLMKYLDKLRFDFVSGIIAGWITLKFFFSLNKFSSALAVSLNMYS